MKLSLKWLSDFVDINSLQISNKQFAHEMTMTGSKVESYEVEAEKIKKVVVGKIVNIEKHPNAEKLVVCSVDIGEEELIQVITAATNVKQEDKVPVALVGSTLANGDKIKKSKLRGVESYGMFCSLSELGLTVSDFPEAIEDGIFILNKNSKIGDDIKECLGLNDTIFEFELTTNRPDCFSVIGLAREVAATFNKELNIRSTKVITSKTNCEDMLKINVQEKDLCLSYNTRIVKNVKIEPSPLWIRERLRAMGVKPINNIVDITNYVMLLYGQPMHAFDYDYIEGNIINIRKAQKGESITTLDNVKRVLSDEDLVIADAKKPLAIAGVIGGEDSKINNNTKTIVFESANFEPNSIRNTSYKYNIRTDSSLRFEKDLDPNICNEALNCACELIEKLNAGEVVGEALTQEYFKKLEHKIKLEKDFINNFLNTNISKEFMQKTLLKLGCKIEDDYIIVPTYRKDLINNADIAEEIARFYGYDKIKSTKLIGSNYGKFSNKQKFIKKLSNIMTSLSFNEVKTYSFTNPQNYDKILMPKNSQLRDFIKIENPLGEETSIMRTDALASIIETVATNYNNRNKNVNLFEIAREYTKEDNGKLPIEKDKLIACMYGENIDFYKIKGIAESILNELSIIDYDVIEDSTQYSYHPGRCAKFILKNNDIGVVGELNPKVYENFGINCKVYALAFDINTLFNNTNTNKIFKPLPKFPSTQRDLAVICDEEVPALKIKKIIANQCKNLLESIDIFDVYKGSQIEEGKKSVAFSIILRSEEKTLTEEEVNSSMKKIIKELKKENINLRD